MGFEWDANKAAANLAKHGISFEAAARVFDDPDRISIADIRRDYGEARTNTTGMVRGVLIVTVTHLDRDGTTRLISARPASRKERRKYHGKDH